MAVSPRYQTLLSRFLAGVIDGLVFIPLLAIDWLIFKESRPITLIAGWAAISYLSYNVYSVILHAKYGQTLGKMLLKVKVLSEDETTVPGFKRALLRDSVYIFLMVLSLIWFLVVLFREGFDAAYHQSNADFVIGILSLGWIILEVITILSNPRRRAIHDYIGGTVVVNPQFIQQSESDESASMSLAEK